MERIFDIHCQSEDTADLTLQGKMEPSTFDRYFPVPTGVLNDFAKQFQMRIVQIIYCFVPPGFISDEPRNSKLFSSW